MNDTSPEIEDIQISLIRRASTAKRMMCMISLSQMAADLSKRAISRAHPDYNQREIDLLFVGLHYGDDLADRLRNYLDGRTV